MATLHELITKVIPLKGILRIPSYWMRKVLTAIADAVEAVHTELVSTSDKLAHKDDLLAKSILYAKTGQPFLVLGEASKPRLDGAYIDAEPYKIYKGSTLSFHNEDNVVFKVTFIISAGMKSLDFSNCIELTSLGLSNFDTSEVTSMERMFYRCTSLTSLDLSNFDTSKVTNMSSMFYGCSGLTSLDLSNFDTSAVTSMGNMFNGCSGLTSLDLSNFDTSAVTSMGGMFSGCSSLTSLDVSSFDTSKVTIMYGMFQDCTALRNIKCKQAFKDWCITNASTIGLTVANITWEIVE